MTPYDSQSARKPRSSARRAQPTDAGGQSHAFPTADHAMDEATVGARRARATGAAQRHADDSSRYEGSTNYDQSTGYDESAGYDEPAGYDDLAGYDDMNWSSPVRLRSGGREPMETADAMRHQGAGRRAKAAEQEAVEETPAFKGQLRKIASRLAAIRFDQEDANPGEDILLGDMEDAQDNAQYMRKAPRREEAASDSDEEDDTSVGSRLLDAVSRFAPPLREDGWEEPLTQAWETSQMEARAGRAENMQVDADDQSMQADDWDNGRNDWHADPDQWDASHDAWGSDSDVMERYARPSTSTRKSASYGKRDNVVQFPSARRSAKTSAPDAWDDPLDDAWEDTSTLLPVTEGRSFASRQSPIFWLVGSLLLISLIAVLGMIGLEKWRGMEVDRIEAARVKQNAEEKARYKLVYRDLIESNAYEQGVHPAMVAAVVHTESRFDPKAVSYLGARGLMQIMEETGDWIAQKLDEKVNYTFDSLFKPEVNVRYGTWYLGFLTRMFDGDITKVAAGYHAGQSAVQRWLADPVYSSDGVTLERIPEDYASTAEYVEKVVKAYDMYIKHYYPSSATTTDAEGEQSAA